MEGYNTTHNVLVLGDTDTAGRSAMLEQKAAENGAQIVDTFAFEPGAPAGQDDLTQIEEVVAALSRAISTQTDIWLPFPLQDLCREQHFRRLSVALQRHGLNLLMGPEMTPSPTEGGYNEIDAALRREVRAVDELDHAALASAAVSTLGAEIESLLASAVEQHFSTREAARFFGKSPDWLYRTMRQQVFTYPDGTAIEPLMVGKGRGWRFTLPMLREMARSCRRHGMLTDRQFRYVFAELSRAEG